MASKAGDAPAQRLAVFLSHTSELRELPHPRGSFVEAAKTAVNDAGHTVIEMGSFPPDSSDPTAFCLRKVGEANVYVGIIGVRYGTPVPKRPRLSYTELEFEAATRLKLPRLVFLVRKDALPPETQSEEHSARQAEFRRRLQTGSGITIAFVDWTYEVSVRLFAALRDVERLRRLLAEDEGPGARELDVRHGLPFVVRRRDQGRSQEEIDKMQRENQEP